MSPSCMNGLSRVGLTLGVGAKTNSTAGLIKDLTTGRLVDVKPNADFNARSGDGNSEDTTLPKLEIRSSPGKGLGLFAVDDIPAYSKILEDYALLSLAEGEDIPELWQKYSALPAEEKHQFDQLGFSSHQAQKEALLTSKLQRRGYDEASEMVRVQSRFMANAFKEDNSKWRATLFLTVARINHSCTPNAQTHYRPASGAKVVYSFRDIKAGEEIEISYFGITMPYRDRQNRAKSWGFLCNCPACSGLNTPDGSKYERALLPLQTVLSGRPSLTLDIHVRTAIEIAMEPNYPWLVAALPSLYFVFEQCQEGRKEKREERLAALESALMWECRITGPESPCSRDRRRQLRRLIDEVDEK